jgi:hypothetical protein
LCPFDLSGRKTVDVSVDGVHPETGEAGPATTFFLAGVDIQWKQFYTNN